MEAFHHIWAFQVMAALFFWWNSASVRQPLPEDPDPGWVPVMSRLKTRGAAPASEACLLPRDCRPDPAGQVQWELGERLNIRADR